MKRIISLLALFLALAMLAGCGILGGSGSKTPAPFTVEKRDPISLPSAKPADVTESTAEPTAEPTPEPETLDPAALLNELMFHVDLINSCYAETCGAQLGSTQYSRVYASDEACRNGEAPIDVVPAGTMSYEERHDLTDAALYEILNYSSNNDAYSYLAQYMSYDLADSLFPNQFLEMNGKLYMVYGSRGYGEYQLDPATAVLTDVTASSCTMLIDGVLFDERTPIRIDFERTNGGWIAVSIVDTDC